MAELNFKKLADAPILEEVPDGAKVYAEVEGKVYRVAGDNLGGGGGVPMAVITINNNAYTCDNMTFEEVYAMFTAHKPFAATFYTVSNNNYGSKMEYVLSVYEISAGTLNFTSNSLSLWWSENGIFEPIVVP